MDEVKGARAHPASKANLEDDQGAEPDGGS